MILNCSYTQQIMAFLRSPGDRIPQPAISRAKAPRNEAASRRGSQLVIELKRSSAKVAAVRSRQGMRSAPRARARVDSSSPRMRAMKSGGGGSSMRYGAARRRGGIGEQVGLTE